MGHVKTVKMNIVKTSIVPANRAKNSRAKRKQKKMTTVGMSIATKIAKMKGAQMKARNMKTRQIIPAENARIGMKIMKTVEINAARPFATMVKTADAERITAEIMISAGIAPFRDMK